MPRWTALMNVKITEQDVHLTPQGQVPYLVSQTEYTCGGDAVGEAPNLAIAEVLKKLRQFLMKMNLPEFDEGKES